MDKKQQPLDSQGTSKTNLQLLNELLDAPTNTVTEKIMFCYKADHISIGFQGGTGIIDEAQAGNIYKIFYNIWVNYKSSSATAQAVKLNIIKSHITNRSQYSQLTLLSYVWLLERIGILIPDNFNGVVYVFRSSGIIYYVEPGKAA